METIAKFIERLAIKAGIPASDQNLINVLSNADLSKVTVPAEIVTGIDNNLLSIDQAGDNHPVLKRKYHAQAFNAFDARLAEVIKNSGLSPEKIAELTGENNTYQRFENTIAALQAAHTSSLAKASAKAGSSNEDKTALQRQVDDLLGQIQTKEKEYSDRFKALTAEREKDRSAYELRTLLGGAKTIFDDLPAAAKNAALEALVSRALSEREASFAFDETGNFSLLGKDGSVVVGDNHTKYTPQTFVDEVLAKNKVIKVNEQPNGSTTQNQQQQFGNGNRQNTFVPGQQSPANGNNMAAAAANRENREAFAKRFAS